MKKETRGRKPISPEGKLERVALLVPESIKSKLEAVPNMQGWLRGLITEGLMSRDNSKVSMKYKFCEACKGKGRVKCQ